MLVPTLVLLTTYQALATAGSAPTPPDCSLNGEKRGGVCVCDKPWSGPDCSTLNFKPVTFPQGYGMAPKLTSWGGNAIEDPQTGKYHIFVSAMTNNCTLQTWGKNSRIEHGIADTITGPYKFVDVAIPTWSHNSAPIALKDGTFAIVHIGTGVGPVDGGANCSNQPPPAPPVQTPCKGLASLPGWNCSAHVCAGDGHTDPGQCGPDLGEPQLDCKLDDDQGCAAAAAKVCAATKGCTAFGLSHIWEGGRAAKLFSSSKVLTNNPDWSVWSKVPQAESSVSAPAAGSTIHTATSLNGPWVPLMKNTLGSCNNPAPWVHKNGTIYCLCGNTVLRSENISGPWAHISSLSHSGGPAGSYEDPFLYTDERGWHLIYHVYNTHENPPHGHECVNSTVSAHAYSQDGYEWHMSPVSPYGTQVQLTSGETVTVATRERPKLWFNRNGQKTHLFNGVCSAENCPNGPATGCVDCKYANWDYTLVQPLDV